MLPHKHFGGLGGCLKPRSQSPQPLVAHAFPGGGGKAAGGLLFSLEFIFALSIGTSLPLLRKCGVASLHPPLLFIVRTVLRVNKLAFISKQLSLKGEWAGPGKGMQRDAPGIGDTAAIPGQAGPQELCRLLNTCSFHGTLPLVQCSTARFLHICTQGIFSQLSQAWPFFWLRKYSYLLVLINCPLLCFPLVLRIQVGSILGKICPFKVWG